MEDLQAEKIRVRATETEDPLVAFVRGDPRAPDRRRGLRSAAGRHGRHRRERGRRSASRRAPRGGAGLLPDRSGAPSAARSWPATAASGGGLRYDRGASDGPVRSRHPRPLARRGVRDRHPHARAALAPAAGGDLGLLPLAVSCSLWGPCSGSGSPPAATTISCARWRPNRSGAHPACGRDLEPVGPAGLWLRAGLARRRAVPAGLRRLPDAVLDPLASWHLAMRVTSLFVVLLTVEQLIDGWRAGSVRGLCPGRLRAGLDLPVPSVSLGAGAGLRPKRREAKRPAGERRPPASSEAAIATALS